MYQKQRTTARNANYSLLHTINVWFNGSNVSSSIHALCLPKCLPLFASVSHSDFFLDWISWHVIVVYLSSTDFGINSIECVKILNNRHQFHFITLQCPVQSCVTIHIWFNSKVQVARAPIQRRKKISNWLCEAPCQVLLLLRWYSPLKCSSLNT